MKFLLIIFNCLALFGCVAKKNSELNSPQWFNYEIRVGVTGIDKRITVNKKEIDIVYHKDSDQIYKTTLLALKHDLFNVGQNEIKIYGYLLPGIQYTISGVNNAQCEPFQCFKLLNWTIKTPILYCNAPLENGSNNMIELPVMRKSEHFLQSHFRSSVVLDPSVYEAK